MVARFLLPLTSAALLVLTPALAVETLRHPPSLEQQLQAADPADLAAAALQRGDAARGALVFYKSAAACGHCHLSDTPQSPLGPNLASLGPVTGQHVIESLLDPAAKIRPGYETYSLLTTDGDVITGMLVRQDDAAVTLRDAADLSQDLVVPRDDIESIRKNATSMMPAGLIGSIGEQRDFLDLVKYIVEVAAGGPDRATQLKPSAEQLAVRDDTANLDHAGILKSLRQRDFDAGQAIYHGDCSDCHGHSGNTPSLPTARAFGTQKLRFGSDPYRMFMTLSLGNGLMAPMSHLTPKERYQVVHYIREKFMKPSNPDYFNVTPDYLAGLPTGTEDGTWVEPVHRDLGPALASQLRRQYSSVLTIPLGDVTVSYDLHTMDLAGVWRGGFLDLSQTQHARDRGEGTAVPAGDDITPLATWRWGHDGTLDYPTEHKLPRGPLPPHWMHYRGHHLDGDRVLLSYRIDGRDVLELPRPLPASLAASGDVGHSSGLVHSLHIAAGDPLVLAVATGWPSTSDGDSADAENRVSGNLVSSHQKGSGAAVAAAVTGDITGMQWRIDDRGRLVLQIPADTQPRNVDIWRLSAADSAALDGFVAATGGDAPHPRTRQPLTPLPQTLTGGGPTLWPEMLTTVGTLGLEQTGYALDTLTLPDSTPWNTWFRTSALDFFPDGRMALATYGGDIWIVSGIDDSLLNLRWKRFASGLYEPMGVKVFDGHVYVTCKDRLTKLHDRDGNGEADFYESFSADEDVSVNFHAFNFDLQVDSAGNFYYAKSGHGADSDLPGAVFKVAPDGSRSVLGTGFRTPNGIGILPDGRVVASDNQGQWTPASKISLVRPGGFYGWVQTYSIPGMWQPGGGTIDLDAVVPPSTFDPPLIWMPQEFDNSSGGQLYVDDPRFGPLAGHLLHTSFGKGWMSYAMLQEVDDVMQAAIIKLPLDFRTGIMRARVNPADGQVYATGLQGWNGGGRIGLREGGVQRVRFTGQADPMVVDCQVESDGLRIDFNVPLDPTTAGDPASYVGQHWNYHWRAEYGSDQFSPTTDRPGPDPLKIIAAEVSKDGRRVKLTVANLQPVDQLHLRLSVQTANAEQFQEEIYWTIHKLGK